jgi:hypothetical protein
MKPFKGRIRIIDKGYDPEDGRGLGYYYICEFLDHPAFGGKKGHTSMVFKDGPIFIETRNSRYEKVI